MNSLLTRLALLAVAIPLVSASALADDPYDVVIYGGTTSGLAAGVAAARLGAHVIVLEPTAHVGGISTSGLSATDRGVPDVIGGLAREFFQRLYKYYEQPSVWTSETRAEYLPKHPLIYGEKFKEQWFFEPHVAELLWHQMLDEAKVPVALHKRLDRSKAGIVMNGPAIVSIRMEDGSTYAGKTFIDATYEGDLMALAGVKYVVGRESNATYGETLNGIHLIDFQHGGNRISPFVKAGDPKSGLLPGIESKPPGEEGGGDHRVQAYNFRLCLTDQPNNRRPIDKPDGYDPLQYELYLRAIMSSASRKVGSLPFTTVPMPNHKTDTNNHFEFSTDLVGGSYDWPDGSYADREKIWEKHKTYVQGLLWFVGNDPRVPSDLRDAMNTWGLAKDEFVDSDNWPPQLYVREARRMVGDYIMLDKDPLHTREAAVDRVAMGSYAIDSHYATRFINSNGELCIDGGLGGKSKPYGISYRSLLPNRKEATNLLVPVCCSASHAAYASIRMEDVFVMLGQASGTAAAMATHDKLDIHDLPYADLKKQLLADGAILSYTKALRDEATTAP